MLILQWEIYDAYVEDLQKQVSLVKTRVAVLKVQKYLLTVA